MATYPSSITYSDEILRRKNSLRGKHKFRNHLYYEIGEEKLQDELD